MAKIAILGSSYSAALIDWRNKNFDINDYKDYDEYFYEKVYLLFFLYCLNSPVLQYDEHVNIVNY